MTVMLTGSESSSSVALSLRLQPLLSNGRKSGNVGQTLKTNRQTIVTDIQVEYSNRKAKGSLRIARTSPAGWQLGNQMTGR